jgi:transcriptional regulator with XRE-family HTH domain
METTDETFNLRLFRKANKLTQDDVADYLGVSKAFISQVETGKVSLPDTQYLKIIQNRDWSVSEYRQFVDTYESVKNQALGKKAALLSIREKVDEEALYRVPLLPIFAQAGHLTGWSESVTEVECERVISPVKDIDMAVHIYGESMYPDIPNGSVVYVRKVAGHAIDFGRAYILDTTDGPIVKYIAPGSDDAHLKCISANHDPRFADYEILKTDILGMYRVVMCMKMM